MKIFYHKSDLDGVCSGAIVLKKFPDAELFPIDYGEPFPFEKIEKGETVYMVDFCLEPWSDMIRLSAWADLVWIDHHKTAIESRDKSFGKEGPSIFPGIQRVGIGACVLCWEFLFGGATPAAVQLLGEYDVWNHENHLTLPFQYGMRVMDLTPTDPLWKQLLEVGGWERHNIDEIVDRGELYMDWQFNKNKKMAQKLSFEMEFGGLKFLAANRGPSNSKFFDSIWDPNLYDGVCLFWWNPETGNWSVRLYSDKKGVDVSGIAQENDGGGHAGAAGFECASLPFAPQKKR